MSHQRQVWWSAIDTRRLSGGRIQVLNLIEYAFANGLYVWVPKGYVCDLASLPRWLASGMPDKVKSSAGAILHDRCYSHAEEVEAEARRNGFPNFCLDRAQADSLAELVWEDDPDMGRTEEIYWLGVRIGGGRAWEKHRLAREFERVAQGIVAEK